MKPETIDPSMSIIDNLYCDDICTVTRLEDGTFEVRECCDNYYSEILTADQLRQWGEELIALSQTGKER